MLPYLTIGNKTPAFYDIDSESAIEQTARLYKTMNELIDEYNVNVEKTNEDIEKFIDGLNDSNCKFKSCITETVEMYIKSIDLKFNKQNEDIEDAVNFMKENLNASVSAVVEEMKTNGELNATILNALNNIQSDFDNLTTKVTEIEELYNTLHPEIVVIHNELIDVKGSIQNINNELIDVKGSIQNINNELIDVNNDIENVSKSIPKTLSYSRDYYYIDCINGSDNNNGLSVNTPFKTLNKFMELYNTSKNDLRCTLLSEGNYYIDGKYNTLSGGTLHIYGPETNDTLNVNTTININNESGSENVGNAFIGYNCRWHIENVKLKVNNKQNFLCFDNCDIYFKNVYVDCWKLAFNGSNLQQEGQLILGCQTSFNSGSTAHFSNGELYILNPNKTITYDGTTHNINFGLGIFGGSTAVFKSTIYGSNNIPSLPVDSTHTPLSLISCECSNIYMYQSNTPGHGKYQYCYIFNWCTVRTTQSFKALMLQQGISQINTTWFTEE